MAATKEQQYITLRQTLKEKIRKKMYGNSGKKITTIGQSKIKWLKETRDYSFLLSDDHPMPVPPKPKEMASKKQVNNSRNVRYTVMPGSKVGEVIIKSSGVKQDLSRAQPTKKRPAREDEDYCDCEAEKALSIIRKMYNTQRFVGRDDSGNKNMESSCKQIEKEEKRSGRLARQEDQEQLRLLQQEEGMRKKAKKL